MIKRHQQLTNTKALDAALAHVEDFKDELTQESWKRDLYWRLMELMGRLELAAKWGSVTVAKKMANRVWHARKAVAKLNLPEDLHESYMARIAAIEVSVIK